MPLYYFSTAILSKYMYLAIDIIYTCLCTILYNLVKKFTENYPAKISHPNKFNFELCEN